METPTVLVSLPDPPPSPVDALPNELLNAIFEHLFCDTEEEYDTISPVDKLLLVCKRWHYLALANTMLWSRIEIIIRDSQEIEPRTAYAASRIQRSGSLQLLDITLETIGNAGTPENTASLDMAMNLLLETLSGPHGEISIRWKSLDASIGRSFAKEERICQFLSFPTPSLNSLSLSGVESSGSHILPYTPSLQFLYLGFCALARYPSTRNVTHLQLSTSRNSSWDMRAIAEASLLQELGLDSWYEYTLMPAQYPSLRSLYLRGRIIAGCIRDIVAPNLKELTVLVDDGEGYAHVAECPGIDLGRLDYAQIGWPHYIENASIEMYLQPVRNFLNLATGLKTLEFEDKPMATLVFKLLTTDCQHLFQEHVLTLRLDDESVELGHGERRLETLNDLRRRVQCSPPDDATWEDIYRELASCLDF
ncbi:hypothetical protein FRC17_009530 [Serendipita sp. 399]|nr:hypothetical protein FRC17_009530 [Serendipita sp. 399]